MWFKTTNFTWFLRILNSKGNVQVFSKEYRAFTTGKSNIRGNEERLFLCKVGDVK